MRLVLLLGLLLTSVALPSRGHAQLRPGDLVFQTSRSRQSRVIRQVTGSPWTHVGVVLPREGELWVLEAVSPVRWTRLDAWRRRGVGGRVLARRLPRALTADEIDALRREGERLLGRPYDARFEWGDARLYCSELVWMIYERALGEALSVPQRWRELRLGRRARRLARRRLGRLPRPDAIVVTPAALAESPRLVPVSLQ
ncbi:MAG: YiiX family permuted papain-like enzyme [Sandaracinaceae bacterium]